MRLQLVCVGALRAPHDGPGGLYQERVDRLAGLRVDEVAAEPLQRGPERARRVDGERLWGRVLDRALTVALDPAGRAPESSERFAAWLEGCMDRGRPVAFLLGGAPGLDPELRGRCDRVMSLGPLTMPHQLARVVLTEQLYRALCINRGHPYPH